MKKICPFLPALFFALSLFGQDKTNNPAPDAGARVKPTHKTITTQGQKPEEVIQGIENNMVYVAAGTFMMGCPDETDTSCYYWENPVHTVSISNFYIGKYTITQREWESVTGYNPCFTKSCPDCPVENVTWYDVQVFINKLNQMTGRSYRLPTEAEWEYAAGGGNKSKHYLYAGSNNPDSVAWYDKNSDGHVHPVGKKKPNELGLYDMSGNVFQWCSDWFDDKYYSNSPPNNPLGPRNAAYRVCRGGSWWSPVSQARVVHRDRYPPDAKDDDVGFRLARD